MPNAIASAHGPGDLFVDDDFRQSSCVRIGRAGAGLCLDPVDRGADLGVRGPVPDPDVRGLVVPVGPGQVVADLSGQATVVPFAILGMCGYLAGVTQAPLTSFVIVMEMTTQHAMVLPLMITAAVATTISKLLSPPLYQTLANRYGS